MPDPLTEFGLDLHVETHQSRRRSSLEDALRRAIRSGRLVAGQRIPSSRAMAEDLGWARGTVASAYEQLVAEGYLEARTGVGTVVAAVTPHLPAEPVEPRLRLNGDLLPGAPEPGASPRVPGCARPATLSPAPCRARSTTATARATPSCARPWRRTSAAPAGSASTRAGWSVTAGVTQGLWLIARVVAARGGRTMAMEDPCHGPHRDAVLDAGLEVLPLRVDSHGARVGDLADLRPDAVFVTPAHQYPMGVTLSPERRQLLVAWARSTGTLVIEDDYDEKLRYDRRPVGALQGRRPITWPTSARRRRSSVRASASAGRCSRTGGSTTYAAPRTSPPKAWT